MYCVAVSKILSWKELMWIENNTWKFKMIYLRIWIYYRILTFINIIYIAYYMNNIHSIFKLADYEI
jgi:hypothetical protein